MALKPEEAGWLDQWLAGAQATGTEPLISFFAGARLALPERPCKLPTVRQYTRAVQGLPQALAAGEVISPWNEANHRSQPTFKNPKRAAQYYNVVRKYCRGCKIVAADVIDEVNMERWLKVFKRTAKKPRIWGLHNYRDTNKRKGQRLGGTKRLLKAVRGQVWLTETGGIVKFVLPSGGTLFPYSESRANTRDQADVRARVAATAVGSSGSTSTTGSSRSADNRFDAGLPPRTATPRPAYSTVRSQLAHAHLQPVGA